MENLKCGGEIMTLTNWDKTIETGIPEVDIQHKKLLRLINQLYNSIIYKENKILIKFNFNNLVDYTNYHFTCEERGFESRGKPIDKNHSFRHKKALDKIQDFKYSFYNSENSVTPEELSYFNKDILEHIREEARDYKMLPKNSDLN